jgi:hypothetical protein
VTELTLNVVDAFTLLKQKRGERVAHAVGCEVKRQTSSLQDALEGFLRGSWILMITLY